MSHIIVNATEMHKIACLTIKVKYRCPGNVIEYVPVEFEIFQDGKCYKAMPQQNIQTKVLTALPDGLVFKISEGRIFNYVPGKEEVVEDIVNELVKINLVERPRNRFVETVTSNSTCQAEV